MYGFIDGVYFHVPDNDPTLLCCIIAAKHIYLTGMFPNSWSMSTCLFRRGAVRKLDLLPLLYTILYLHSGTIIISYICEGLLGCQGTFTCSFYITPIMASWPRQTKCHDSHFTERQRESPSLAFRVTQGLNAEMELDSCTLSSAPSCHSHEGLDSRLKPGYQPLEREQ